MASYNKLSNYIKERISAAGPMTFAAFMELALYHREWGYYTQKVRLGRQGDFYTSPHVNPVFGRMLANQLKEMWTAAGEPSVWTVVEYGPGEGILARDILTSVKENFPALLKTFRYRALETSDQLVERQKKLWESSNLQEADIEWVNSINELTSVGESFQGCIFSNELIDAFPVHIVRNTSEGLKEIYVTVENGEFTFVPGNLSSQELQDYFTQQGINLAEGQTAEVNLNAINWLNEVAKVINRGFILTIDYGAPAEELYSPARFNGTVRCFSRHQLNTSPLDDIGHQDITSSVNFTALQKWGEEFGLLSLGTISQSQFLINLGILEELKTDREFSYDPAGMKKIMAVKQLIMPEGMGQAFKVLVQYKGFNVPPELSGMRPGRGI